MFISDKKALKEKDGKIAIIYPVVYTVLSKAERGLTPMKLSIIVPVYNAAPYLGRCLHSLLCQDLSPEDYEILCIDDGSTDSGPGLLAGYAATYPNIRMLRKENGGVTTARNLGLAEAKGEFIWFVDADDIVRENILSKLWSAIEESGCDRLVVDAHTFTDRLNPEDIRDADSLPRNTPWQDAVVWRNILRLDFLKAHELTFRYPELTHGEDGLYMYEVAVAGPKTVETGCMAYFYRVHSGSAETGVSTETRQKKLRSYLRLTEIMTQYYHNGQKNTATANKLMSYLWLALYETARLPKNEAAKSLERLHGLGLYPGKRLPECDLESAYLMGGPGVVGKALDEVCMNLQRPWAYHSLRFLRILKK